jgi:hypothetical protein
MGMYSVFTDQLVIHQERTRIKTLRSTRSNFFLAPNKSRSMSVTNIMRSTIAFSLIVNLNYM